MCAPPDNALEGHTVMDYRIYLLEPSGDFRNVRVVICLDDSEAIETARPLLAECAAVEIWQGARMVGALP